MERAAVSREGGRGGREGVLVSRETGNEYRVLGKVGEGAYAEVFRGENVRTGEAVAVKKMKHLKKADAEMARKEVELMKTLQHKNIVRFIDQFRQNGAWYIVLEYCGKGDLEKYKQKVGKIPEFHCKVLVRGILEALVELHTEDKARGKRKIAHRDLKLPNILISDDYQLKLADFGFSKDFEDGWMKSFCGTPLTMAPEVLRREAYNEKCDVWSLGVITYFLLYNKYPYFPSKSDGQGLEGIANCVLNKPLLFDKAVPVSEAGRDFVAQCLQKPLDRRPFSHDLLAHPWFGGVPASEVRRDIIGESLEERPEKEALVCCKVMLFGVVEEHVRKLFEAQLVGEQQLRAAIALFRKHYGAREELLEYFLLLAQKRLEDLTRRSFVLILENRSIKVPAAQVARFMEAYRASLRFLLAELLPLRPSRPPLVNIDMELVKFLLAESELLMDSYSEDETADKLRLLAAVGRALAKDFESSIISVKWGEREDLARLGRHVLDFIVGVRDEEVLACINEELANEDDLESVWLIEHQILEGKDKKSGSIEVELAKQILYILSIPSNFTAEKSPSHSDQFDLDLHHISF